VYLGDDERLIVHDSERGHYEEIDDTEELRDWFPRNLEIYVDVAHALGETPEIEI
jgi:hypothetical protein